jgi:hypothetical protein
MNFRTQAGQTLPLAVGFTIVLALLGCAFFLMSELLGGHKESQNSVDASCLNMTKEISKNVGISLNPGIEQDNFSSLVDPDTNQLNLLYYNRVIAQALVVAANAQQESTSSAISNAQSLFDAIQNNSGQVPKCLAARLSQSLSDPNGLAANYFSEMETKNTLRLLGNSAAIAYRPADYGVSYMNRYSDNSGAAANISVDTTVFPSLAPYVSSQKDPNCPNASFLQGYNDFTINNIGTITAVTLNPGQGPHLVSRNAFNSQTASPSNAGTVPPNAFTSSALLSGQQSFVKIAAATTGALKTFSPGIPGGFIRIRNLPGITYNGLPGVTTDTALNYELFDGLYLVNFADGTVGFAANADLLQNWINYNQQLLNAGGNPAADTSWPVVNGQQLTGETNADPPATVFDSNGNPATRQELGKITGFVGGVDTDGQPRKYTYLDLDPQSDAQALMALYSNGAIDNAHNYDFGAGGSGNVRSATLTSIEDAKALLITNYYNVVNQKNPQPTTINTSTDIPGATGLRLFDHSATYVALPTFGGPQGYDNISQQAFICEGSIQFTTPGSALDYLNEINGETPANPAVSIQSIKAQILQRLQQINPSVKAADVDALLSGTTLDLGETAYIYNDPGSGKLIISKTAPSWVSQKGLSATADGTAQECDGSQYNLLGNIVNPVKELGLHGYCFGTVNSTMVYNDATMQFTNANQAPAGSLNGEDSVVWTPSSGFGNLLGDLVFKSTANGSVQFSAPN